ncbi:MAG: TIR domain-containing protein [Candidatus Aenigmarchaeota archaeon]|nr:TIR domain-containing protein [Candidatus Aenigmarchaeota archaeon]
MAVKEPKKKPRTFISFHHKDRHAKELLKAQSKNKNIPLYFTSTSQDKPFSNKWKTRVKKRIQNSSNLLVVIGKDTYKSKAVNWEIEQARKMGKKVVGVQIHKGKHHRLPSAMRKSEELKRWKVENIARRLRKRR